MAIHRPAWPPRPGIVQACPAFAVIREAGLNNLISESMALTESGAASIQLPNVV